MIVCCRPRELQYLQLITPKKDFSASLAGAEHFLPWLLALCKAGVADDFLC